MTQPKRSKQAIWEKAQSASTRRRKAQIGAEAMRTYERIIMLNIIDAQWKDHLLSIDHLKQGIGLVGYGQKDPLVEYKKQSFDMFQEMLDRIDTTTDSLALQSCRSSPSSARTACSSDAPRRPASTDLHRPEPRRGRRRRRSGQGQNHHPRPTQESAATNHARAAPARNTRSAAALLSEFRKQETRRRRGATQTRVAPLLLLPIFDDGQYSAQLSQHPRGGLKPYGSSVVFSSFK